ncbi:hypothetical protein C9374_001869 [Naegleria lovaniensis]|uniref:Uncharacterized protein n=1 Tax=Naegleria lovaniensis TaxID=51637 RepID=A0AA88GVA7_NAELO|nr:uncharacterized protein C9374_001869 [Naegleria lovaniensis]KAG2386834.1 hypothetical protein C9374_001869 [Naegleria lovaniensis]
MSSTQMDHVQPSSHSTTKRITYKFHSSNMTPSMNTPSSNAQPYMFNFKSSLPNIMSSPIEGIRKKKKDQFQYASPTSSTTTSVVSSSSSSPLQKSNVKDTSKGNLTAGNTTRECLFYVQTCQTDTRGKLIVKRNREPSSSMKGRRRSPPLTNVNLPNVNFSSPVSQENSTQLQKPQTLSTSTVSTAPLNYVPDYSNFVNSFKIDNRQPSPSNVNYQHHSMQQNQLLQEELKLLPSVRELLNQSASMTSASCHQQNSHTAMLPCVNDLISHGFQFTQSSSIFTL